MAIVTAACLTLLLVAAAMVLDFGLVRMDRQQVRSAADNAVMAGLQAANGGTTDVLTFQGVCGALSFLKANQSDLSTLPSSICASPSATTACSTTDATTWAAYDQSVTVSGVTTRVQIKMPYLTNEWGDPEESLGTLSGDLGDPLAAGCDQLGVRVTRSRKPGLGTLATADDLTFAIRSAGRVYPVSGDVAPALLLLERTKCRVLSVGSAGAGSGSHIYVLGSGTTAGTIHADSAASDSSTCGTGTGDQVFLGKQSDGVVAYGAAGPPATSGTISTYAAKLGVAAGVLSDSPTSPYSLVRGTTATTVGGPGTPSGVTARGQVKRTPVDNRYLAGVKAATSAAYSQWNLSHSGPTGYTRYQCPTAADMTALAALTATASVYIDCPSNSGITLTGTIGAGTVYFHGFIKNGNLRLPNATKVYIDDTDDSGSRVNASALTLTNSGSGFCVRASACGTLSDGGQCSSALSVPKTQLVVRRGTLDTSGGLLRLCNTTAILQGGDTGSATTPGGCLPTTVGTAPTATPCPSSSAGDSSVSLAGQTDWTAPNQYGDMAAAGLTAAQKAAAWTDGEDLALWTETYGSGSTYKMAGGGAMNVRGVFMVPNAAPFTVSGSGSQNLTNAQYIATSFAVDGGATLTMSVDPNNAVTLPKLGQFTLIR